MKASRRAGLLAGYYESTGTRAKSIAQAASYFGFNPRNYYA